MLTSRPASPARTPPARVTARPPIFAPVQPWELDYHWLRVRHFVKDSLRHDRLPDLQAVLMLVGVQALGRWRKDFTKEEKQDLMHVGTCEVLSGDGYYAFTHRDADGWPHYEAVRPVTAVGHAAQERLLKERIISYFDQWASPDASAPTAPAPSSSPS